MRGKTTSSVSRAYGPTTQRRGERAYGYDIFFKYPDKGLVLEKLYGPETSPKTWQTVDSLRAISKEQAEEYINSISYHIDHGLGMDCYAVGPTLGDGVAARLLNDSIAFAWCYESAEVLDNGPLRFTARLKFAPKDSVSESRIITLDAGKHLNACTVSFDGLRDSTEIVAGVPRRDDSEAILADNYIAYADPTQGPDNGKAMLGVIVPTARPLPKSARATSYSAPQSPPVRTSATTSASPGTAPTSPTCRHGTTISRISRNHH